MIDLEQAGAELVSATAVTPTPLTELRHRAVRRRRRRRGAAGVFAIAFIAGIALRAWPFGDAEVNTVVSTTSRLPLPVRGEVTSGVLHDGSPVFVVRHRDGTVSVVSAISAHRPFGLGELVGWCPSSRWFEEPAHAAQFDEHGVRMGGPAPSGLVTYDATIDAQGTVTVGSARAPAPTGAPGEAASGPHCVGPDDRTPGLVLPSISTAIALAPAEAAVLRDSDYHVVQGVFVVVADGSLAACADTTPCAHPVLVSGVDQNGGELATSFLEWVDQRRFLILARSANGALRDVVRLE